MFGRSNSKSVPALHNGVVTSGLPGRRSGTRLAWPRHHTAPAQPQPLPRLCRTESLRHRLWRSGIPVIRAWISDSRGRSTTGITAHLRIPLCVRTQEISAVRPPRRSPCSFRVAENARLEDWLSRCSLQAECHARGVASHQGTLAWHSTCNAHIGPFISGRHACRPGEPGVTPACLNASCPARASARRPGSAERAA